ncbi:MULTISPECIES: TetR/AcrR family transcriptional regulator [unclassified Pseudonocardia]|uniref:TetR/AcrR family transcriptional regulator n=1 Tax=unclassified Pseudonocardia TaxID=2619320 RepID=UPI0025D2FD2B|nr:MULTISPECIES: TetR/AcrR family transcriptional regulator [unclassified Pseudonocardia]
MADGRSFEEDVELLWGLRDTPRRGPRPTLTVDEIVRAAVDIADTDGLAAVSMARVAERLGNAPMALYRHVRSKSELLTLMADAAMDTPPPPADGTGWRPALTAWARGIITMFRAHPWAATLPLTGPPVGPRNLAWFDAALAALDDTGLAPALKVGVVMGLITYVQGEIRLTAELAAAFTDNPEAFGARYGAALARVVDPRTLPALAAVVAAGVFDEAATDFGADVAADFDFGLECFLDGVAVTIERRG